MSPELSTQAEQQSQIPTVLERLHDAALSIRHKLGRIATVGLLAAGTTFTATTVEEVVHPAMAYADTFGYPYANAPCEYGGGHNPSGNTSCTNPNSPPTVPNNTDDSYNWYENGGSSFSGSDCYYGSNSECFDPWGYQYDNCTSYVAWQLTTLGVSASKVEGLGNGGDWYANAPSSEQTLTPAYGEAAAPNGTVQALPNGVDLWTSNSSNAAHPTTNGTENCPVIEIINSAETHFSYALSDGQYLSLEGGYCIGQNDTNNQDYQTQVSSSDWNTVTEIIGSIAFN